MFYELLILIVNYLIKCWRNMKIVYVKCDREFVVFFFLKTSDLMKSDKVDREAIGL